MRRWVRQVLLGRMTRVDVDFVNKPQKDGDFTSFLDRRGGHDVPRTQLPRTG